MFVCFQMGVCGYIPFPPSASVSVSAFSFRVFHAPSPVIVDRRFSPRSFTVESSSTGIASFWGGGGGGGVRKSLGTMVY